MLNEAIFTSDEGNNNLPLGIWKKGKYDGNLVYYQDHKDVGEMVIRKIDDNNGSLEPIPNDLVRFIYVASSPGAGKSYFASQYISKYLKLHKKAIFFLVSDKIYDEPLDKLKPIRIRIDDELVKDPITIDDVPENSIWLFDDVNEIIDEKHKKAVNDLICRIIKIGRSKRIYIILTNHDVSPIQMKLNKTIMSCIQAFVFFPGATSPAGVTRLLNLYYGIDKKKVQKILDTYKNTRWIYITRNIPQILMTQHDIIFINDI